MNGRGIRGTDLWVAAAVLAVAGLWWVGRWYWLILGVAFLAVYVADLVIVEGAARDWMRWEPSWTEQQARDFVVARYSYGSRWKARLLVPVRRGWLGWV